MSKVISAARPKRWEPSPPPPRLHCERVIYEDGEVRICCAPSKGRTYCAECRERAMQAPQGSRFPSVRGHRFQL